MADYVSIANLAASKIGEDDQLSSPDDDTRLGRAAAVAWDLVRRAALRDHSWNFAMQRRQLAAAADVVPVGFATAFPLPAECLRLIEVLNHRARLDYEVEGRVILANTKGPLAIRFIADIDEPALWDDLFVEAFACRLAFQIADIITGDRGRKSDAWSAYQDALTQAKRVDARENPPITWEATSWETSRYNGWYGHHIDRNGLIFP